MSSFETLVRLHTFLGNPGTLACPFLKLWYVCTPFLETLVRLHGTRVFGNPGTFACLFLKPWYVCTRVFGNPGTLAYPFLKPWNVCMPFLETLLRLHVPF